jgi:hypothetical protein
MKEALKVVRYTLLVNGKKIQAPGEGRKVISPCLSSYLFWVQSNLIGSMNDLPSLIVLLYVVIYSLKTYAHTCI